MKRIILVASCIFFAYIFSLSLQKKENSVDERSPYRIAVLLPVSHAALDEIQQGFLDTLSKEVAISFDIYNGNGDRMLMRSQAEHALQHNYDLICAITTPISIICKEISTQRKKRIPVVCCAVSEDPVEIGLVDSIHSSGNNFVVVSDHYDFKQQLQLLLKVRPIIRIILPYFPSPGLEKQVQELTGIGTKYGLEIFAIKIYNVNELYVKVDASLSSKDEAILVLKDNLIVSGIEALIALARKKHIPLYASDLNSVDKGAVLGFGVQEYTIGVAAAQKALSILRDHQAPSSISSSFIQDFITKINLSELTRQNLVINKTHLLEHASMIFVGAAS